MNNLKKRFLSVAVGVAFVFAAFAVSAEGLWNFHTLDYIVCIETWSNFHEGHATPADYNSHGLLPNKYVKQCAVRLTQGSFDSGYNWSEVGRLLPSDPKMVSSPRLTRVSIPFVPTVCQPSWRYHVIHPGSPVTPRPYSVNPAPLTPQG